MEAKAIETTTETRFFPKFWHDGWEEWQPLDCTPDNGYETEDDAWMAFMSECHCLPDEYFRADKEEVTINE